MTFLFLITLPMAYGKNINTLTLISHFNYPIRWIISENPDVLPGFTTEFTLAPFSEIKTQVLDLQKEAYLSGIDEQQNNAFWGIEVVDNQLVIHGYRSKNIAYSWTSNTITFCTPDEYNKQGHC